MKAQKIAATITILLSTSLLPAVAGPNDFFGNSVGGAQETQQGAGQVNANGQVGSPPTTNIPAGEYSSDEKRVQKKYKANVKVAQAKIHEGEEMMRSKDDKVAKKGRVIKEIGEKWLNDLKANNPFPETLSATAPKKTN